MADAYDKIREHAEAGEKKPKKEIADIHIKMSHNGKHIVKHIHHHPMHHPDETHVMNGMSDLHDHMEKHASQPNEGETAPGGGDQVAQLTAAPTAAPAMGGGIPPTGM